MLASVLRNNLLKQLKVVHHARNLAVKSISRETMQTLDPEAKRKELFYTKSGTKELRWFESERCVSTVLKVENNTYLDPEYPTREQPRYYISINLKLNGYEDRLIGRKCSESLDMGLPQVSWARKYDDLLPVVKETIKKLEEYDEMPLDEFNKGIAYPCIDRCYETIVL